MVAVAVVLACTTAATTPAAKSTQAAKPAARAVVAVQVARPVAGIAITAAVRPVPTSSRHSAFPSIAQAPDGSLTMVSRGGFDHAASKDGRVMLATGTFKVGVGIIWSGESTLLTAAGVDYRDPSISYVDGHEYLTFFTASTNSGAEGAYVVRDRDVAHPIRIDALPYAAISAPIVRLPNGVLGAAFYGHKSGESIDTAWMGFSSDLGQSWTTNRILNDGSPHAEPVLLVRNGVVHLLARGGADTIVMRSSTNSGASGSWDTPHVIVGACTGRPSATVTAAGTMVMVCRGILPSPNAQVAYSVDPTGAKWWWGPLVLAAPAGSFGMTYAAMYEVLPGVIHVVAGMEQADGSSALWGAYLAESVQ